MTISKTLIKLLTILTLIFAYSTHLFAADQKPNKKRGQVYFKMVCTVCHKETAGRAIPPSDDTMALWSNYFNTDVHDKTGKTNSSVRYYISQDYRQCIKEKNKAAKKFLKLSDDQLYADLQHFVVNGAKDSDTPATCN